MTSRERLIATLNHQTPDRLPLDLGATSQTGINASSLYQLRKALHLDEHRLKIIEPGQLLGEVEQDLLDLLGVDVVGLFNTTNYFGYKNDNWKKWEMDDGTPVWMGGGFTYDQDETGKLFVYPQGDTSAEYSAILPKGGTFFDCVPREKFDWDLEEEDLTPLEDFKDDFSVVSDEETFR